MKSDFASHESIAAGRDGISVSTAEAMAELRRVIDSPDFDASPRNRRFLSMVVEGTLEGRRITGRDVAVKAFGRPETFDPSKDPIVRIECSKLRKALEMYYLKSGRHNRLKLTIPHGRYRAVFCRNNAGQDAVSAPQIEPRMAALLRGALAGWAGERADAVRVWDEFQRSFPGFPHHSPASRLLEVLKSQDEETHELVREGLRRLEQRAQTVPGLFAVAS